MGGSNGINDSTITPQPIEALKDDMNCGNCIHNNEDKCLIYSWSVNNTTYCHDWINKTTFDLVEVAKRAGHQNLDELPITPIYAQLARKESNIDCSMCKSYGFEKDEFRLPYCSHQGIRRGLDKEGKYQVCWEFKEILKPKKNNDQDNRRPRDEKYLESVKQLISKGRVTDYDLALETIKHVHGNYISVSAKSNKDKLLWIYDGSIYQIDYNDALQKELLVIVDSMRDIVRTFKNNADNETEQKSLGVFLKSLEIYLNVVKLSNLESMIKSMLVNNKIKFDEDLSKINTKNYLLDIITLKKIQHDRNQYYTKCLPYDWNPASQAPMFMAHLEYMFPNQETRKFVIEVIASCLFRKRKEEVVFFFWGPEARNGKTTLLQMVTEALGTGISGYAAWLDYQTFTEARAKNATQTELKQAIGKAIAVIDEPAKESLSSGTVKNVSNFGRISFRGLYEETTEYQWTATLIFLCNTLPSIDTSDQGNARRPIVIPCKSKITDQMIKTNSNGIEKYGEYVGKTEAQGIFNTLLVYAKKFADRGYVLPPMPVEIVDATQHYQLKGNTLLQFINEMCIKQMDGKVQAGVLKDKFYTWCDTQGITRKAISFNIKEKMESMGFQYKTSVKFHDGKVTTGYLGLTWRTEIGNEGYNRLVLNALAYAKEGLDEQEVCDLIGLHMEIVRPALEHLTTTKEIIQKPNNFKQIKYFIA